jgi:hypothetical protein
MQGALLRRVPAPLPADEALLAAARSLGPGGLQVCVALDRSVAFLYAWGEAKTLSLVKAWRGASHGEAAPCHYVVATDVEPEWEAEFNDWYDTEHMPGLAAVPGNVRCARLRRDGSPRYHACYDLASPQVLERPEWLAVRHTEWSARVRPRFRNTERIMFRTLLNERTD